MNSDAYVTKILNNWEEVAKRGQLTLWVLLALKDGPKHMADIKRFIAEATHETITADDRSLYRALRRYHQAEMLGFKAQPGSGPDRKVYELTPIGSEVLRQFIRRNITDVLFQPKIVKLLKEEYHD
jgi:PadR family transcriptional regulator PadR